MSITIEIIKFRRLVLINPECIMINMEKAEQNCPMNRAVPVGTVWRRRSQVIKTTRKNAYTTGATRMHT